MGEGKGEGEKPSDSRSASEHVNLLEAELICSNLSSALIVNGHIAHGLSQESGQSLPQDLYYMNQLNVVRFIHLNRL
jgi:hypothetical protein